MSEKQIDPAAAWRPQAQEAQLRENAPGWTASVLVHAVLLALFLLLLKQEPPIGQHGLRFVPVTLVPTGGQSNSPRPGNNAAPLKAVQPTPAHHEATVRHVSHLGIAPKIAPKDEMEAKLENLSKLSQPQSGSLPSAQDFAATEPGEGGEGEGRSGPYGVRDLVRAQVLRRWSLNFETLAGRDFSIPIRVELKRDGTVLNAEIVDQERFRKDKIYRDVAISARNAVLLSSPLVLPAGRYADEFQLIVLLNPRDTQR
ncbi:MAG TPA: hypothetical protein VGM17_03795 [Rhizomicrobium sp.]|jgi:hypothetical protein